jgi:peptide/nickel transport system substrate-binding protein
LTIFAFIQFTLGVLLPPPSLAQEWEVRRSRGTLRVVDLFTPTGSAILSYAEGLVTADKDNNVVPCLAKDWRWIDDRTIEFKLRGGVNFHNGEEFNADAVRINWEAYRKLKNPRPISITNLPDETVFKKIDNYLVSFTLPEPDGLALLKFTWFFQVAPAFFKKHKVPEKGWGYLPEAGPWGTGPFKFMKGKGSTYRPSDQLVLEAYEDYWDPQYPKVKRVLFDNTLIGNRKEAMRLCKETEGSVDIVTQIRPLDTLKVAMSKFAKVVKSRDVTLFGAWFNQRKRDSKWRDVRLRRALNYAINRKELWKYGAKGNAYNLEGFGIPPGAYGHNPNLTPWTYDTTKARKLLADAGYPEGFEVKVITNEAWKLETQIIRRMLERIGLKVKMEVLTSTEHFRKIYIPLLEKPPEEQDWDLSLGTGRDFYGHIGATILALGLIEVSDYRWIEYDSLYEEMWKDMSRTVDKEAQEKKLRQMQKYLYDHVYGLAVYTPLTLYAVNKEINFVPQKSGYLRLKETSVTDKHWSVRGERK